VGRIQNPVAVALEFLPLITPLDVVPPGLSRHTLPDGYQAQLRIPPKLLLDRSTPHLAQDYLTVYSVQMRHDLPHNVASGHWPRRLTHDFDHFVSNTLY
jgi:hypothetical protein